MFVQQHRFGNYSSGDSEEDVSEGDLLQVTFYRFLFALEFLSLFDFSVDF